jgi:hypothetical protein
MRRTGRLCRGIVLAATAGLLLAVSAGPAGAGGSWLEFEETEYLPGETARASGTASITDAPGTGWVEAGPYYGYVIESNRYRELAGAAQAWPFVPAEADRVGQIGVVPGPSHFPTRTFTLEFVVPQLPRGQYSLMICNDPCALSLGDFVGGELSINAPGAPPFAAAPAADDTATPPPGSSPQVALTDPIAAPAERVLLPTANASTQDEGPGWWLWPTAAIALVALGIAVVVVRNRMRPGAVREPELVS